MPKDCMAEDSRVDVTDVLRLRFAQPPPPGSRLLFRRRKSDQGRVTVLDGDVDLEELELTAGIWDAYLVKADHGSPIRLGTRDPGFSLDGLREYASRSHDLEIRAYRTDKGNLSLRVRPVRPLAEVSSVGVDAGVIQVHGVIAYVPPALCEQIAAENVRLAARARTQQVSEEFAVTLQGTAFHASVDLDRLTGSHRGAEDYWDCWLETVGGRMRLGKHLDDVKGKKNKLRYPPQIREEAGRRLRIWPYYTADDDFSITVRELDH